MALQGTLLKSNFLGQNNLFNRHLKPSLSSTRKEPRLKLVPCAKFDLFEILGGRGLCNGEQGIQLELKRDIEALPSVNQDENSAAEEDTSTVPENAFEKELMGLTGGFPGGEKGLKKFVEENPPPKKQSTSASENLLEITTSKKPKAPELPLLMPGMIAIVSNPNNPYYMLCGIVQRITDGKAAVLFEGGIWDRLITFRLEELQRREKGPPGKNAKSAILEELIGQETK
ncbi:NAD(P)H-quinone oxidoreductase subunit S, chloroplastic-like [Mercurialis annua]|uniref:NAD(P)H-quinone oxidoreductase subunit S, chloroplastic-like n=1 Tax=Mercurialis annua TaxID=3986 RepID=UPI00215FFB30|nr:NAD(P)H-quinone oxidoreductase subunit S, chloroplastic-like [Mercurialis annua]XP_050228847.1 NAD(P)H-quinone oxidoreductase subunit S, chloroplastic-like [Mercurialis annua]